MHFFS